MTKVLFFLLYMINGNLKLEQKLYTTPVECKAAGNARVDELATDPHVDGFVAGGCIEVPAVEAKNNVIP